MFKILYILVMLNPVLIQQRLAGLVGFTQPYNPEYQKFDAANIASRSGLRINSNPYVKGEFIYDCQDYKGISDVDFNTWVRTKIGTSIINVCNNIFSENDYIDRGLLYKYAINKMSVTPTSATNPEGNFVNTYELPPGFVCYWIRVKEDQNIAFNIKRVFLEFNGTGPITLYLYNTKDFTTPLFSQTVNVTSPIQEVILNDKNGLPNGWTCDNTDNYYKGDYYLGYFTQNMTLQPFSRQYREGSIMSKINDLEIQRLTFTEFTSPTAPIDLFRLSAPLIYNGLNPDITTYEDVTDLITQNEKLLAYPIMIQCQIDFLSEIIASVRTNRMKLIGTEMMGELMAVIEGQKGEGMATVTGLMPKLYGAISRVKKEIYKAKEGFGTADHVVYLETLTGDDEDITNG